MSIKSKVKSQKPYKIRLQKGDTVVVLVGKDKGKTGKVTAVHPALNKVTVEGVNIVKKHVKPNRTYPQGDIARFSIGWHTHFDFLIRPAGILSSLDTTEIDTSYTVCTGSSVFTTTDCHDTSGQSL